MLVVLTQEKTNRLTYIFRFIFEEVLRTPLVITSDVHEFKTSEHPKINYSHLPVDCPLRMSPHSLLFEHKIAFQTLEPVPFEEDVCFFESSADSFFPFDPFAASFYLISRYEEYLMHDLDKHRRYPSHHSVLYRNHLLTTPVVNKWAHKIAHAIQSHYPEFTYQSPVFDFRSTVDVDNAWAYKNKSWMRTWGALAKGILRGDLSRNVERMEVLHGKKQDPYDTYGYICERFNGHRELLHFFILLGKNSRYDRNVSPKNEQLRLLIKDLNSFCEVGLHPSYRSTKFKGELAQEIKTLKAITGKEVSSSRQHFLRLELPKTYQRLLKAGITNDYTMGYADQVGFRAGTSSPFYFYDLKKDQKTALRIHPFQMMDVTLKNYLKLNPEEALLLVGKLMDEIRKYGGTFISLWHNESVSNQGEWQGWQQVFETITEQAIAYTDESAKNKISEI